MAEVRGLNETNYLFSTGAHNYFPHYSNIIASFACEKLILVSPKTDVFFNSKWQIILYFACPVR